MAECAAIEQSICHRRELQPLLRISSLFKYVLFVIWCFGVVTYFWTTTGPRCAIEIDDQDYPRLAAEQFHKLEFPRFTRDWFGSGEMFRQDTTQFSDPETLLNNFPDCCQRIESIEGDRPSALRIWKHDFHALLSVRFKYDSYPIGRDAPASRNTYHNFFAVDSCLNSIDLRELGIS